MSIAKRASFRRLVNMLRSLGWAVKVAKASADEEALATARQAVNAAKV